MGQIKHSFKKVSFVIQSFAIKIKHNFPPSLLIKFQDLYNLARGIDVVKKRVCRFFFTDELKRFDDL